MRRFVLTALVALVACGRSPSGPTTSEPVPVTQAADFSGLWTGSFRLTGCDGDRHCFLLKGTTRPYSLRLQQSGSRVQGLLIRRPSASIFRCHGSAIWSRGRFNRVPSGYL